MPKSRTSPNFSQILTPTSPARTDSQVDVIARQMRALSLKNQNSQRKLSFDSVSEIKPQRVVKTVDANGRSKRDTKTSTSQNHIISDFYVQKILDICVKDIVRHSQNNNGQWLADRKKQAVEQFLKVIFHSNENNKLQEAKNLFAECINGNIAASQRPVKRFCQFVASNGSNNAVEGNASVNSGVSKNMDAPLDKQGRVLKAFANMRDAFVALGEAASLTPSGRSASVHKVILDAISPNICDGKVRASSLVYKEPNHTGSFEAPAGSYNNNLRKGSAMRTNGGHVTRVQEGHIEDGHCFERSPTPRF